MYIYMPYALLHLPHDGYAVQNKDTKKYKAKHTTKLKAEAQIRLLESLHNKIIRRHRTVA
jgi:hypothetical protein